MLDKLKIRVEMLKKLKSHDKASSLKKSGAIKIKLFNDILFKKAKVVMFYVSKDYEVNTHDMIDDAILNGKTVVVPKTENETKMLSVYEISSRSELLPGGMGIMEPQANSSKSAKLEAIDLIIVPGIAFDKLGHRIGHGKGYYDRFLKKISEGTSTIGLAFDFQVVDKIPASATDFPVQKVISA